MSRKTSSCAAVLAYRVGIPLIDPYDLTKKFPHRSLSEIQSHFVVNWAHSGRAEGTAEVYQAIIDEIGRTEKRCNSRMFREFEIALPHEGTDEQRSLLTERFSTGLSRKFKIPLVAAIHFPPKVETRNYHAHLLALVRDVDRAHDKPQLKKKVRLLDSVRTLKIVRRFWQRLLNRYYRDLGIAKEVSAKSYAALGVGAMPTIHEGPGARVANGNRPGINKAIRELNASRKLVSSSAAQIHEIEDKICGKLRDATLSPRQRKQSLSLEAIIRANVEKGGVPEEIMGRIKNAIGRGNVGRSNFNRLRKSLPPSGGDSEVIRARDGVELLALLFECCTEETLEKVRRWCSGEKPVAGTPPADLEDSTFLKRLHEWEISENSNRDENPPSGAGGDIPI